MAYDQDYYAQGRKQYRLHRVFQPLLFFLYWWSVKATLARCHFPPRPRRRALDVGAGRGEFLYFLRKRGWEVVGTQVSQSAIDAARENYNLDLLAVNLPLAGELGKFDLITYWHTFEHLENPKEHLHQIKNLLKDQESVLVIEVPNPESLGAKICFTSWLGSDVQHHINLLTRSDLVKMVHEAGLNVVRVESFSPKFTVVCLYSALCGWLSRGSLSFDFLMELLKRPFGSLFSQGSKIFLWILISPVALTFAILLAPAGILWKRPETIRLYVQQESDRDGSPGGQNFY